MGCFSRFLSICSSIMDSDSACGRNWKGTLRTMEFCLQYFQLSWEWASHPEGSTEHPFQTPQAANSGAPEETWHSKVLSRFPASQTLQNKEEESQKHWKRFFLEDISLPTIYPCILDEPRWLILFGIPEGKFGPNESKSLQGPCGRNIWNCI